MSAALECVAMIPVDGVTTRLVREEDARERITDLESKLQAALARAAQDEAREAELRRSAERVVEVISSGHTADDLYEASDELERALAFTTPVAEAMGRVVEAVTNPRLREQVNQLRIKFPLAPDGSGPMSADDHEDFEALCELLKSGDALQAARAGRGEGGVR